MEKKFACVIPTVADDYGRTKIHYLSFFRLLPVNRLIFIGPAELKVEIKKDIENGFYKDNKIDHIEENDLVEFSQIKKIYEELRAETNQKNPSSVNWYYQQFLKMAYSERCSDDYYLCWDSDTIPVRKIEMFSQDGTPYLDYKTEFQNSYFKTIERLFGFGKVIEKSFISEHMLFNKILMREMIGDIEKSNNRGKNCWEKIIYSMGADNLACGFSEFETYGSWVAMNHTSEYKLRSWNSFRNLSFFIDIKDLTREDIEYLAADYHAVTFEKYQKTEPYFTELFRDKRYREKLSPKQFYTAILETGVMGEYSDGVIKYDGIEAPV